MKKPEICLVMIVRDEEDTIEKCIDSVAPYISYWVIVDTGSVDSTKEKVHEVMGKHNIPGELHESEWVDFAHNRTESLELSKGKGDWRFIMDADDTFTSFVDNPFASLDGKHDAYHLDIAYGAINYKRVFLMKSDQDWVFEGKRHNYPVLKSKQASVGLLHDCQINAATSAEKRADSVEEKYSNDAKILLSEHKKNPSDTRTIFYLAQSYRDAGKIKSAINWYKKRAEMGGWAEEVYYSLLQVAELSHRDGRKKEDVLELYRRAWESRPGRLEAVYSIMRILHTDGRDFLAFTYGMMAYNYMIQQDLGSNDFLFVHRDVHKWMFIDELSLAAFRNGQAQLSKNLIDALIASKNWMFVSQENKARILKNLDYYNLAVEGEEKKLQGDAEQEKS